MCQLWYYGLRRIMNKLDKEQLKAVDRLFSLCWQGRDNVWRKKLASIHKEFAYLIDIKVEAPIEDAKAEDEFMSLWHSLGGKDKS